MKVLGLIICTALFLCQHLVNVQADASAPNYQKIGCFKDDWSRAIPTLEGQDSSLDGDYRLRENAIEKCYQAAKKKGFQIFAVQNGGQCFSSATASETYDKYGKSSTCLSDGEGGPWGNQVYRIKGTTTGSETGCGQVSSLSKRIVGGAHASPGEWPWHVQMHWLGYKSYHFCSGTLITPQWVITAAHCLDSMYTGNVGVTLGELDLNAESGHEQTYGISKAIKHPDYGRKPLRYDFALMKLAEPATINKHVRTVCLPESTEKLPVNTDLWETGWGLTKHNGQQAEFLKELEVIVEDPKLSQYTVHSTMFITKTLEEGHGTCRGDSGGPVVREENGRWILEGVHSWGRSECAIKGQYDGQADVRTVLPWIKETMKNN